MLSLSGVVCNTLGGLIVREKGYKAGQVARKLPGLQGVMSSSSWLCQSCSSLFKEPRCGPRACRSKGQPPPASNTAQEAAYVNFTATAVQLCMCTQLPTVSERLYSQGLHASHFCPLKD